MNFILRTMLINSFSASVGNLMTWWLSGGWVMVMRFKWLQYVAMARHGRGWIFLRYKTCLINIVERKTKSLQNKINKFLSDHPSESVSQGYHELSWAWLMVLAHNLLVFLWCFSEIHGKYWVFKATSFVQAKETEHEERPSAKKTWWTGDCQLLTKYILIKYSVN